jgi:hypothetical protein
MRIPLFALAVGMAVAMLSCHSNTADPPRSGSTSSQPWSDETRFVKDGDVGTKWAGSVATDRHGDVYVSGRIEYPYRPGGWTGRSESNQPTAFLSKFDHAGNLLWNASWAGGISSSAVNSNGDIIVQGGFQGVADFDPGPRVFRLGSWRGFGQEGSNTFISRFDSEGRFLWARETGWSIHELNAPRGVAIDGFGNSYVLNDELVVYDPRGNVVRSLGRFSSVFAVDEAGNIYEASAIGSGVPGFTAGSPQQPASVGLRKADPEGNTLWQVGWTGLTDAGATGVTCSSGGSVYVVARFSGTVDLDPGPGVIEKTFIPAAVPTYDSFGFLTSIQSVYFLAKFVAGGAFEWALTFDEGIFPQAIESDSLGSAYLAGNYRGEVDLDPGPAVLKSNTDPANRLPDFFRLKLDASGRLVWSRTLEITRSGEGGTSLAADDNGFTYMVGGVWPDKSYYDSLGRSDVIVRQFSPDGD